MATCEFGVDAPQSPERPARAITDMAESPPRTGTHGHVMDGKKVAARLGGGFLFIGRKVKGFGLRRHHHGTTNEFKNDADHFRMVGVLANELDTVLGRLLFGREQDRAQDELLSRLVQRL